MARKKKLIVKKPLMGAFGISNYPGDEITVKDPQLKEEMLVKGCIAYEEEEKKEARKKEEATDDGAADGGVEE